MCAHCKEMLKMDANFDSKELICVKCLNRFMMENKY